MFCERGELKTQITCLEIILFRKQNSFSFSEEMSAAVSPFPLLFLPENALRESLRQMDQLSLICLTLTSSRCKDLVTDCEFSLSSIKLTHEEEFNTFHLEFGEDAVCLEFSNKVSASYSSAERFDDDEEVVTDDDAIEIDNEEVANQNEEVVTDNNEIAIDNEVVVTDDDCGDFRMEWENSFSLKDFIKHLYDTFLVGEFQFHLCKTFNPITLGNISDDVCLDTVMIDAPIAIYSEADINNFLSRWIRTGVPSRFSYFAFYFPVRHISENNILEGIGFEIVPAGTRREFKHYDGDTTWYKRFTFFVEEGYDIKIFDQTIATLTFSHQFPSLEMYVWNKQ
ncbi:hypothetical protein CAEBREN_25776 [Caenorhabditis brenneri]|uniref:F-box domain-containing protein n=1 Tax=Caenorhabditis brenneri TaxID=135651 RepID=G0MGS6_CAEBE|nr:hypothetical protein CAEBREN_25776 [Caenorhabditis brenneri]